MPRILEINNFTYKRISCMQKNKSVLSHYLKQSHYLIELPFTSHPDFYRLTEAEYYLPVFYKSWEGHKLETLTCKLNIKDFGYEFYDVDKLVKNANEKIFSYQLRYKFWHTKFSWMNIKNKEKIKIEDYFLYAPEEPGKYILFEITDLHLNHLEWYWYKELSIT